MHDASAAASNDPLLGSDVAHAVRICPLSSEAPHCAAQAVTSGANPVSIKKGIDKTCDFLVKKLKENARPVKGSSDIKVWAQRACCHRLSASSA